MSKSIKTKKIKLSDLKPGDKIKSYCPDTHNVVFNTVVDVWDTLVPKEEQMTILFHDGSHLHCSTLHPIMVNANGETIQKIPEELTTTDEVISTHGIIYMTSVSKGGSRDPRYMDVSVEGSNLFFAQAPDSNNMILVHNCNQGGVRGGAATAYFPFWHLQFEDLVVLKNNKGTDDNRARHMDYAVQFNKLAYERLLTGGNLTLFSPSDVPGMYDAFFADQDEFKRLYEQYEADPKIRKKTMKAVDLFTLFMSERKNTGRVYWMNVDHVNTHGAYIESLAPIRQSNLCAEISLPTMPLQSIDDTNPAVALCTLAAINWGKIREPKDFEKPCKLAVRALDALLDYQDYPLAAAQAHTTLFRPLGIGITNLAYWIAKMGFKYSDDSALSTLDEYAEAWSYYMIRASVDLAMEKGAPEGSKLSKYGQGIVPIDTRKQETDELVGYHERLPWHRLRDDLRTHGVRNTTLLACMPSEASSLISNSTNGIEPPRALISVKQSKDGVMKQVVPEYRRLKNRYELLWDQKSPEGYLKICAVLQRWMDQTISTNTSYNPQFYPDRQLPMSELLRHMLMSYKWGIKTAYYFNTNDLQGELDTDKMIQDDVDETAAQAECDSCTI